MVSNYISQGCFKLLKFLNCKKPSYRTCAVFKLLVAAAFGSCVHIFMASFVFSSIENWSYLDSIYHTFITVSTIGFGDYVPGMYI